MEERMSKFNVGQRVRTDRGDIRTIEKIKADGIYACKGEAGTYTDSYLSPLSIEDVQTGDIVTLTNRGITEYVGILFASEYFIVEGLNTSNPKEALSRPARANNLSRAQYIEEAKRQNWTLYLPDEVEEEMIEIKGKPYSVSTIDLALKAYVK